MKLSAKQINTKVRWYLKRTGVPKSFLARQLSISMPTLYARLEKPALRPWTTSEINKLHSLEIIYAPSCPECGEIVDLLEYSEQQKKHVCNKCKTT